MQIKELELHNFRNAEKEKIVFSEDINILCGENAQGKTNALEGIYLFAQGRSFRSAKDREFVSYGKDIAYLRLSFHSEGRDQVSEIRYNSAGKKSVRKNGVPIKKLSEFVGAFRAVVFCPEHLSMIKNGPHERRKFLDTALCQLFPSYIGALQRYNRVLEQRNRLLSRYFEKKEEYAQTIDLWNAQLAKEGAYISKKRAEYTEKLDNCAKELFESLTDKKEVPDFRYLEERDESELLALLEKNAERDKRTGTTNAGIHKDDIEIMLNSHNARSFASQGQQRSLALAMKLAEAEISAKMTGEYPVLLLDDVLSELDENRRKFVSEKIKKGQVIISACDKELFSGSGANIITVSKGRYT